MTDTGAETALVCPYRATCGPCGGPRELFQILLNSGELTELRNVGDVELTDNELVVTLEDGQQFSFRRDDIYFAGCGRVAVPFHD